MVRLRPLRALQYLVSLCLVISFMILFSRENGGLVIPAGGKVFTNIRQFIRNDSLPSKWDPWNLFGGSYAVEPEGDNVVFKYEKELFSTAKVQQCLPKQLNFIFVKTHKAGSTTLISILQRFGYQHNLLFALPSKGDVFLGWPYPLNQERHVLPLANGSQVYNVLVNHAVFNDTLMHKLITDNPKHIGIVREPLSLFKSSMNYFKKMLRPDNETDVPFMERVVRFTQNPYYYDSINNERKKGKPQDPNMHIRSVTRNLQSADFGLVYQDMDNATKITQFIDGVKRNFPFLLVMEYLHESLLLLKRKWCWTLSDILFLQKNVFKYEGKSEAIPEPAARFLLKNWLNADVQLYNYANETLWKMIAQEKNFDLELSYYKSINNLVGSYCRTQITINRIAQGNNLERLSVPPLTIAESPWNEPLTFEREDCNDLVRSEMAFTRMLQILQRPDIYGEDYYFEINDGIRPFKPPASLEIQERKAKILNRVRLQVPPPGYPPLLQDGYHNGT